MLVAVLAALASLLVPVLSQASNNTATSPECPIDIPGYIHHGNCNLLCRPALWTDILVFFLGNYVAHAATIIGQPGQSTLAGVLAVVTALILPGGGVRSGLGAILSLAKFGSTDLQTAARAGALCAVVKTPGPPPAPGVVERNDAGAGAVRPVVAAAGGEHVGGADGGGDVDGMEMPERRADGGSLDFSADIVQARLEEDDRSDTKDAEAVAERMSGELPGPLLRPKTGMPSLPDTALLEELTQLRLCDRTCQNPRHQDPRLLPPARGLRPRRS